MSISTTIWSRLATTSLVTATIAFGSLFTATARAGIFTNGQATFSASLYERSAREINKEYLDLKVNYQETGNSNIRQAFESLRQSKFAKVLDESDRENSVVPFQEILDIIKTQPTISDESQQVKKWLEEIQKPEVKVADCTIVWCPDCIPGGCFICI